MNITVSRGGMVTYFRYDAQCYTSFCWKFNRLSSSGRIFKKLVKICRSYRHKMVAYFFETQCTGN